MNQIIDRKISAEEIVLRPFNAVISKNVRFSNTSTMNDHSYLKSPDFEFEDLKNEKGLSNISRTNEL